MDGFECVNGDAAIGGEEPITVEGMRPFLCVDWNALSYDTSERAQRVCQRLVEAPLREVVADEFAGLLVDVGVHRTIRDGGLEWNCAVSPAGFELTIRRDAWDRAVSGVCAQASQPEHDGGYGLQAAIAIAFEEALAEFGITAIDGSLTPRRLWSSAA